MQNPAPNGLNNSVDEETENPTDTLSPQTHLAKLNRALLLQTAINQALIRTKREDELFQQFCKVLIERGGYRLAWVGVAEQHGERRVVRPIAQAGFEAGYLETLELTWDESERGQGPTGTAIRTGQTKVARNIMNDPNYTPWRKNALQRGYASSVALPLYLDGIPFGALNLYAAESDAFDAEEISRLTEVAADLMYGVTALRSRIEREQKEQQLLEKEALLERLVAERTTELTTLLELSHQVAATAELAPLAEVVLSQLQRLVHYSGAIFFTYQEERLNFVTAHNPLTPQQIQNLAHTLSQSTILKEMLLAKKWVIIDDLRGTTSAAQAFQALMGVNLTGLYHYARALLFLPLVVKEQVVGMIELVHAEPGYYTARQAELALALGNQAALALENAWLYQKAQSLAVLEERQRLARELHDSTSQILYSIQLGSRTLRTLLERDEPELTRQTLDYILTLAKAGLDEMRALIFELRPETLAREGLVGALVKQAAPLETRHGVKVQLELQTSEPEIPLAYKETLYRVAREAIHNAVKHARTEKLRLQLAWDTQELRLEIEDYGKGFDPTGEFPGHLGLQSMRERVKQLGALLTIESKPSLGTLIRVEVKLNHSY
ncbi:MAG: GAF domain-containing protein [Chloroflexota bacterium]|nr:GAF domain-containing protein [Chloroflexota bacterium]